MLKKYFLALIIFFTHSSFTYAESDFKSKKYHEIILDELSLKEIMRSFYYERLSYSSGKIYEEVEDSNNSYLSRYMDGYNGHELKEVENSILITMPDNLLTPPKVYDKEYGYIDSAWIQTYSNQNYFGAELSPIQKYSNAQGEERYLLGIMIVGLNENHTKIQSTHGAMSITDFYTFKKTQDGKYQLVSRSKERKNPTNSSCRNDASFLYPENKIKFQKIGSDIVGGIFDDCFIMQAYSANNWMILQLLEDDYIDIKYIIKAESNMLEEEDPLYYEYDSDLKLLENNQKYFPLLIHYKGEKPMKRKDNLKNNIRKVDYISKIIFNEIKKEYVEQ